MSVGTLRSVAVQLTEGFRSGSAPATPPLPHAESEINAASAAIRGGLSIRGLSSVRERPCRLHALPSPHILFPSTASSVLRFGPHRRRLAGPSTHRQPGHGRRRTLRADY